MGDYMGKNDIAINKVEIINESFGVYSREVIPPVPYVCNKGDKVFDRFFYVKKGTIIFGKNTKKELRVSAGEIVFLPKDVTYKSQWDTAEKGEYITVNFAFDLQYISLPEEICIVARDKHHVILGMMEDLYKIWSKGELGYEIEFLSGVYKIVHHIFKDMAYRNIKSKNNTIYEGILYIENHYVEDITVEQLAKLCHTSEGNFRRLFKKYKNMSPITYRNYLRMKKALILLNTKEYTITEVAEAVNMPNISYFYKNFKKTFGKTPKELLDFIEE
jgi:YesN/AraC family two-component response regulator